MKLSVNAIFRDQAGRPWLNQNLPKIKPVRIGKRRKALLRVAFSIRTTHNFPYIFGTIVNYYFTKRARTYTRVIKLRVNRVFWARSSSRSWFCIAVIAAVTALQFYSDLKIVSSILLSSMFVLKASFNIGHWNIKYWTSGQSGDSSIPKRWQYFL